MELRQGPEKDDVCSSRNADCRDGGPVLPMVDGFFDVPLVWTINSSRSPSSALLPFIGGRAPYEYRLRKKMKNKLVPLF